jgi:threonylcarbamoyladenosine tRNA methylthiotransferase MtaB
MYGRDMGVSLAELVRRISGRFASLGLTRLRLGSLEPFALDDDLLDALASSSVFCTHLHLPLQSGDDTILLRMRRGYAAGDFVRVCDRAREKLGEDLHISSDILVAFPGETEEAYCRTLDLMRRAELGRVHVFPYSPRRGTEAAGFPGRVSPKVVSERVAGAISLGEDLLAHYASRFVGRDLSVLIEDGSEDFSGYTRNFVSAIVRTGKPVTAGQEIEARMVDCARGELKGIQL